MSAALAFSHGANDAQKSVGVIAALLLADGRIDTLSAPTWAKLLCALALTAGTALGGWRIIRTVGRRIYRIQPIDGLVQPDRVGRRDLRGLARSGRPLDHARSSRPPWWASGRPGPLAPRALGDRSPHGPGVAHHDPRHRGRSPCSATRVSGGGRREAPALVPPRGPTCSGSSARQIGRHDRGPRCPGGVGRRRRARRRHRARGASTAGRGQARGARRDPRGLRHAARARGRVRPLPRARLDPQLRPRPRRTSPTPWPARPTRGMATMAGLLAEAVRHIDEAIAGSGLEQRRRDRAPWARRSRRSAGSSTPTTRGWRRCSRSRTRASASRAASCTGAASRIGETVVDVAERVEYAVVKLS